MAGKIIITEKTAILKEDKKEKVIIIEDLLKLMSEKSYAKSFLSPILPEGIKYFQQNNNRKIVIVEEQPRVRTIIARTNLWSEGYYREQQKEFRLAFPFAVFVFCFVKNQRQTSHLFYRTRPLCSLNDEFLFSNLTHVNNRGGYLCLGSAPSGRILSPQTIQKVVSSTIRHFWNSPFDLLGEQRHVSSGEGGYYSNFSINASRDRRIENLEAWEKASKRNPRFVLNVPWKKTGLTPLKIINQFLRQTRYEIGQKEIIKSADRVADMIYKCDEV